MCTCAWHAAWQYGSFDVASLAPSASLLSSYSTLRPLILHKIGFHSCSSIVFIDEVANPTKPSADVTPSAARG